MLTKVSSRTRLMLPLLALGVLSGCPDPAGKFDEFGSRVIDGGVAPTADGGPDARPLEMLPDINGDFLMGLSVVIAPDSPVWLRVTNTFTDNGDGTGVVDVVIQPLRYDGDHAAVGEPIVANDIAINSAGQYTVVLTQATIPGEANPITGNDIVGDFNIMGSIKSEDLSCGEVTGMVTSPANIDVAGSTFAMVRIGMGGNLPELLYACPDTTTPDAGR